MHASNLQLSRYFVSDISVSANRSFDPKKEVQLPLDAVDVNTECIPLDESKHRWQVTLRLLLQPKAEANAPYSCKIEMVGFFVVAENIPNDKTAFYVQTNGTSVLYSTAREVIRAITSQGPFRPVLLPTVSFYEPTKKEPPAEEK